jgi:hypothetical protein
MKATGVAGAAALLLLGILMSGPSPAGAAEGTAGIEGLTAFRGDFVPGALVLAFAEPGPGSGEKPVAVSGPTDESGRYELAVPPGRYYLLAVKTEGEPWPLREGREGLFCYYLGNPIIVEKGKKTRVGFNMVKMVQEGEPLTSERPGVSGRILFEDEPLGRAYVHVYRDGRSNFRGMGMAALPSGPEGRFRIKLPPGRYYIVARKRQGGGVFGPPGQNDYIGYYHGNPVEVRAGEIRPVTLETTTRVDLIEEIWFKDEKGAGWFRGTVADGEERPVEGVYVLFYSDPGMAGAPVFVAGPSDSKGGFKVRAAEGKYYLLARSKLGGPPEPGEWYGRYGGPGGERLVDGVSEEEIRIVVSPYRGE